MPLLLGDFSETEILTALRRNEARSAREACNARNINMFSAAMRGSRKRWRNARRVGQQRSRHPFYSAAKRRSRNCDKLRNQ